MWRAFGGNTARVAVVIKVPWLSSPTPVLNVIFSPVAYLTEKEAHAMFNEVIGNIETNYDLLRSTDHQAIVSNVFNMLLTGVTCLKHEGFQEEREWRAIYLPKLRPSQFMESSTEVIEGVHKLFINTLLIEKLTPP